MSVKIIIERNFKRPLNLKNIREIDEMRIKALRQKGYVGGETTVNVENPREVLVISSWSSLEDWTAWEQDPQRRELEKRLEEHLEGPARIRKFITSADYAKQRNA